jgi:hypothetical protein
MPSAAQAAVRIMVLTAPHDDSDGGEGASYPLPAGGSGSREPTTGSKETEFQSCPSQST